MQEDKEKSFTKEIRDFFDIRIGHYADKSARWLFKDKENVRGLIEIVAHELVQYLDFSQLSAVNRDFISDTLQDSISDMVFNVPFQDSSHTEGLTIYILIEHQSTVDPMMGFRLLYYMCQIWYEQQRQLKESDVPRSKWRLRPILPIVYYTGSQRWETPLSLSAVMDAPDMLSQFVPKFDTLFIGVKDTDAEDLTKTDHLLGWLLKVLQREEDSTTELYEELQTTLEYLNTLEPAHAAQYKDAIVYLLHLVLFRRKEEERDELIHLIRRHNKDQEVENIIMTGAEALVELGRTEGIKQGRTEGIKQGRTEGIKQGARDTTIRHILTLLQTKFPAADISTITSELESITDLDRLETLLYSAMNISSLKAFVSMLNE